LTAIVKPNPDSSLSKRQQVEEMFDDISGKYDFLNHLLSFGIDKAWRKKVRRTIEKFQPKMILDVATGTGDLALELSKIPEVNILGVDISKGMLDVGRAKIQKKNLQNRIELQQADSEKLPLSDNSFDVVTVSFGVRNFENLENGLKEINRVLKPGAHLVVLEFSKPKNKLVSALYWFYFKNILPAVGKLFSKSNRAYSYLPESVNQFPEGEKFAEIARSCGFESAIAHPLTFGISTMYVCKK